MQFLKEGKLYYKLDLSQSDYSYGGKTIEKRFY